MESGAFIDAAQHALWAVALGSAPLLVPTLIIGVLLGMVQAATSINEATLTFVPKLIVFGVCLCLFRRSDHDRARRPYPRYVRAHSGPCAVTGSSSAGIETQLLVWFVAIVRPGTALMAAPLLGSTAVPLQVRIILSLAVGVPAAASTQIAIPAEGMVSLAGFFLVLGEVLLGLAFGLALQIAVAAALIAGEVISNTMGLGFASMQDPMSGHSSTAIGQYLNVLGTTLFLASNGHLVLIATVIESFRTLPPGSAWVSAWTLKGFVDFGGLMFAAGTAVALPVAAALVLVQLVMASITRSAPALNLFSIGIPATVLCGMVLLAMATPVMADALGGALNRGLDMTARLAQF